MAVELQLRRAGSALVPIDALAEQDLRALPEDVELKASIVQPKKRSLPELRLYFAVLGLVAENMDRPLSKGILHQWVKLRLGVVDLIRQRNGEIIEVPGSVAVEAMEQPEFHDFFEKAMTLICESLATVGRDDLERRAREMLGEPPIETGEPVPSGFVRRATVATGFTRRQQPVASDFGPGHPETPCNALPNPSEPDNAQLLAAAPGNGFADFAADLAEADDWPQIDLALTLLAQGAEWLAADDARRKTARRLAYMRLRELNDKGYRFDFLNEYAAFRCYVDFEKDASALRGNFRAAQRSDWWMDARPEQREELTKAMTNWSAPT